AFLLTHGASASFATTPAATHVGHTMRNPKAHASAKTQRSTTPSQKKVHKATEAPTKKSGFGLYSIGDLAKGSGNWNISKGSGWSIPKSTGDLVKDGGGVVKTIEHGASDAGKSIGKAADKVVKPIK